MEMGTLLRFSRSIPKQGPVHKTTYVTLRLQIDPDSSVKRDPARTCRSEPDYKIQNVLCSYGTPIRNCVSRSTLLYHGIQ
jgi:hypothetical protein